MESSGYSILMNIRTIISSPNNHYTYHHTNHHTNLHTNHHTNNHTNYHTYRHTNHHLNPQVLVVLATLIMVTLKAGNRSIKKI